VTADAHVSDDADRLPRTAGPRRAPGDAGVGARPQRQRETARRGASAWCERAGAVGARPRQGRPAGAGRPSRRAGRRAPYTRRMSVPRKAAALLFLLFALLGRSCSLVGQTGASPGRPMRSPACWSGPARAPSRWRWAATGASPGPGSWIPAGTSCPRAPSRRSPSSWNALPGKPPGKTAGAPTCCGWTAPQASRSPWRPAASAPPPACSSIGVEVARAWATGPSPQASHAAVHSRIPHHREFPCPLRLTLHVSNFDHRGGGMVRPLGGGQPGGTGGTPAKRR
jgi:hypothetical protein